MKNDKIIKEIEKITKENYLEEIIQISKEYGYSLSHEDKEGSFIVEEYKKENIDWLLRSNLE